MADETEYKPRYYGRWAGNPKGRPEDPKRCIESVCSNGYPIPHQCRNKRGHGPGLRYCATHNPEAIAARRAKREAEWKAKHEAAMRPHRQRKAMLSALRAIADGHNDPRALATETLKEWGL